MAKMDEDIRELRTAVWELHGQMASVVQRLDDHIHQPIPNGRRKTVTVWGGGGFIGSILGAIVYLLLEVLKGPNWG